jgi:hypothetical protein
VPHSDTNRFGTPLASIQDKKFKYLPKDAAMLYLTFFSAITLLVALAINLSELNPFAEPVAPMLDQIEAVMAKRRPVAIRTTTDPDPGLPLAA